jgi:hypothetical protein
MKKLISAAGLFLCTFVNAQIVVTTNGNPIANNQTFSYSTTTIAAELPFIVTNNNDEYINLKVRIDDITNTNGSNVQMCFGGLCYFAITEGAIYPTNFAVTIDPGMSTTVGDHFWNINSGDGSNYPMQYKFTFIQVNDAGQYMNDVLAINYIYNPNLATNNVGDLAQAGITKMNTLVSNTLSFESTEAGTIELFDLNGKLAVRQNVQASAQTIDVSNLAPAVYVARFNVGGKSAQVKIVKK